MKKEYTGRHRITTENVQAAITLAFIIALIWAILHPEPTIAERLADSERENPSPPPGFRDNLQECARILRRINERQAPDDN